MKVLLLNVLLFLLASPLFAQSLNGKDFVHIDAEYIQIISNQDESDIYVDFGTPYNASRFNIRLADPSLRNVIKSAEGHEIIFASIIDALNFIGEQGYALVATQTSSNDSGSMYHYIMKRES
jgi:hypothetical protein